MLEKVQRRTTKLIPSIANLSYEDRLNELGMFSVRRRFLRDDMIHAFKILLGLTEAEWGEFFKLNVNPSIRGHSMKLKKNQHHLNLLKKFFSNRVVNFWNGLPSDVIYSDNLKSFKAKLAVHMNRLNVISICI